MGTPSDGDEPSEPSYVSTGQLPPADLVRASVAEAHDRFKSVAEGRNSDIYPALMRGAERAVRRLRRNPRQCLRGRGRRARVRHHERLQAVRVRPGVLAALNIIAR
jgi:hypothetical protein